jgi:allantoinase
MEWLTDDLREPFDFMPYSGRAKIRWPGDRKLAFWVAPNIEFYELNPPKNPMRTPWPRPNPDVTGYSYRDFGNRVGHWRLMEVMDACGVRGSVSLSAAVCDHHPEIIEECVARKWDFFSHGIYNTRYSYGMDPDQERSMIMDSVNTIEQATGQRVRGYLAPALTHTVNTLDLLAELDFWYTCDLFHDDQPQPVNVADGRLISMPYSLEVNDHFIFNVYGRSAQQYADILKAQLDQLLEEGTDSGTVMCIPLHAYLIGRAHRIGPFADLLRHITSLGDDVWITTATEIAEYYLENYYDAAAKDIERIRGTQQTLRAEDLS